MINLSRKTADFCCVGKQTETKKNKERVLPSEQSGVILIVTLFVLLIMTILCAGLFNEAVLELKISANNQRGSFYGAESGVWVGAGLVSKIAESSAFPGTDYLRQVKCMDPDSLYRQTVGRDPYDNGVRDIKFSMGRHIVEVDIQRLGEENIAGSELNFGDAKGVCVLYRIDSYSDDRSGFVSNIVGVYRKVIK